MKTLARQEIEASNRLYTAPKTLLDSLLLNNENIIVPTNYPAATDDFSYIQLGLIDSLLPHLLNYLLWLQI